MRPTVIVCLFSILAAAFPAQAQIMDTGPDVICFYADQSGNVPGVCQPWTIHRVYLTVTRPSDVSGLLGYYCSFGIPELVVPLAFSSAQGTQWIANPFPDLDVVYQTPTPAVGDAYYLGWWDVLIFTSTVSHVSLLDHFPALSYQAAYSTVESRPGLIPLRAPGWGDPLDPCRPPEGTVLVANDPGCCQYVVEKETTSWGGVKGLYR